MNSISSHTYIFAKEKLIFGQPAVRVFIAIIISIIIALALAYICGKIIKQTRHKTIRNILEFVTLFGFVSFISNSILVIAWFANFYSSLFY